MSSKFVRLLSYIFICLFTWSCSNNDCKTSNYIIQQAPFNSTIYNIEVARSINASDSAQVKFIFNSLEEIEGKTYLNMHVQTSEGCIKGRFLATEESGIKQQLANKNLKKGAELHGFSFSMNGEAEPMELLCTGILSMGEE